MEAREILTRFKKNEITLEEAEHYFRKEPFEKMGGYATLDSHREVRSGFPEVIFCSGKADEHFVHIFQKLYEDNGEVFGTRASRHQYELVKDLLPGVEYDDLSHIIKIEKKHKEHIGKIAVCTAGTADIPVAEEAALTAEVLGNHVIRLYDVGVAGLHRLLSNMELLSKANAIIAVAGMEGALASVIGGLTDCPVGVPTSVGYGASFGGISALLSMLNSCASGVSVVNIDNGFGAGYLASMINHQAAPKTDDRPSSCHKNTDKL